MTAVTTYADHGATEIVSSQPSPLPLASVWVESDTRTWTAVDADVTWDPMTGLVRAGFAVPTTRTTCLVVGAV